MLTGIPLIRMTTFVTIVTGDYSLDIAEVTLDDDALYQCQVSSGPRGKIN